MNRVINIKTKEAREAIASGNPDYVYCGRKNLRYGVSESPYHNPFRLNRESERIGVIRQFRKYWYNAEQIALREQALRELPGKTLVCWCAPLSCHCDVIAEFLKAEAIKDKIGVKKIQTQLLLDFMKEMSDE